jgi:hypothetical protein
MDLPQHKERQGGGTVNASKTIEYIGQQESALQELIEQLDEVQIAFNARFDEFKAQHDAALDRLTGSIAALMASGQTGSISPNLLRALEQRWPEELQQIQDRRSKIMEQYLPQRHQAADELLAKAQAETAQLRTLNPQLDKREEKLKRSQAELEGQLSDLNERIRQKSRGVGVVWHFIAITKDDRERQRIIGRLEGIQDSLFEVRRIWETEQDKASDLQKAYQEQWQLESVAVARLQSELDQLNDPARRENLALRRAIRHVVDALHEPSPGSERELSEGLAEMVKLNIETDAFHEGLASVGGMIGLLRGILSGLAAIRKSVEGLANEQSMHSSYLAPLQFTLPAGAEVFHRQWPVLARKFADEREISAHPSDFSAAVAPLLQDSLSEATIEGMFDDLGTMIEQATAAW